MKNICLIGAGNIGSRHLQGLKKITFPLNIEVVDPSKESLSIARQRYEQIDIPIHHQITFLQSLNNLSRKIDLAIIATSSNVRRKVIEELLKKSEIRYVILEKILFQKKADYLFIEKLLERKNIKTWVNFSMRTIPFYHDLKNKLKGKIQMAVSGSQYGLITNVIHFLDYIAFLTDCYNFNIITDGLDKKLTESKRPGFWELTGTLCAWFKDGSSGSFTCYPANDAPFVIEVFSSQYRCISKESERKAQVSSTQGKWKWEEINTNIPFQSEMTNLVAEDILKTGRCTLTPYSKAAKIHLQLLGRLYKYINEFSNKKFSLYPFT